MESVRRARATRSPTDPGRASERAAMPPPSSQAILRLQATAGNHATAALLQRVIKPAFATPPDWYAPLHKLVEDYNKLRASPVLWGLVPSWLATGKPQARQLALTALGDVERWVYAWFGQRGDRDVTADPEWAAMRELLNQVQEERIGLVAIALGDGGDPPLANFAQLGLADRQQVRQIWDDLVSQKGVDDGTKMGIVIEGAQEAARVRILADFSRLLETATGRVVVGGLSGDQPRLTITPKAGAKFAASPVNEALEGLLAVDQPGPGQQFVALDLSGLSVLERKLRLNDVRVNHPKARGVSVITGEGTSHFRFNVGTGSDVSVPESEQDASVKPTSVALGTAGEAIIAPTFVNLGHELGHALRALHGIVAKKDETSATLLGHAFAGVVSDLRPEEFFNIDAIENRIRAEAGLARRGAHEDWASRELLRMFDAVQSVRETAARVLKLAPELLKPDVKGLELECDALTGDLQACKKRLDEIGTLRPRAARLRDRAVLLEERAKAPQEPAKLALKRRLTAGPMAVQRFGIDDRQWNQLTAVRHLGAAAYEVTAGNVTLVVKRSGGGMLDSGGSAEGPIQEGLAAKLGEIGGLGVTVAKTVIVETAGAEGKLLLTKLRSLPHAGPELAVSLEKTQAVLVMERAPGRRADQAKSDIVTQGEPHRALLFSRVGRLWAFDALISNTDRFQKTNWGNVIVGPAGSVVGIDQAIGSNASGQLGDMTEMVAGDVAKRDLGTVLDPGLRRKLALELFASLKDAAPGQGATAAFPPEFPALEAEFVRHFEQGALQGMAAIAALDPAELASKQAELPQFTQQAAADYGIDGVAIIQRIIAASHEAIAGQLGDVNRTIGERAERVGQIDGYLDGPRRLRKEILTALGDPAEQILSKWPEINTWYYGKDAHWNKQGDQLAPLKDLRRAEFRDASKVEAGGEHAWMVKAQLKEWVNRMESVWTAGNLLAELPTSHDAIRTRADALLKAVRREQGLVPLLDHM